MCLLYIQVIKMLNKSYKDILHVKILQAAFEMNCKREVCGFKVENRALH